MGDLTRINANIQALKAYNSLMALNNRITVHQYRLATGKRINSASEDPAGYQLAKKLEARRRGLDTALSNVSNAQNILSVAEGGYQNIMDILETLKEKATQAADYSLNSSQRTALNDQVSALINEIEDIVAETKFNGNKLIDGTYSGSFQTGEAGTDQLSISLGDADSAALGINSISLSSAASASSAISTIDTAITTLAGRIQDVGEYKVRLESKAATLSIASTNTDAVRSSIEDADFAREQMELMKLQILQQTAVTSLTQANAQPQVVLNFFR